MQFALLAPSGSRNDPRVKDIITDLVGAKDIYLYDDVNPKKYEESCKKICEDNGIKTKAVPRPCMVAHTVFVLFKDDVDIVKNRNN